MSVSKKVLIVSSIPPLPSRAGNRVRIMGLIDALNRLGCIVHIAWLDFWPWEIGDAEAMAQAFGAGRVHLIPGNTPKLVHPVAKAWRRIGQKLGLTAAYRYAVDDWFDPQCLPTLAELQHREQFNIVIAQYVFTTGAFAAFPDQVVKVVDCHDLFAERDLTRGHDGKRPTWFSTTIDEEIAAIRRADVALMLQDDEAQLLQQRAGPSVPIRRVGHFTKPAPLAIQHRPVGCFLGATNDANIRGLNYFTRQVLPRLLERVPEFRLVIGGTVSRFVSEGQGICVMGEVGDVRELFSHAAFLINPVTTGTGISIKMLDALACGLPCIATDEGARGLPEALMEGVLASAVGCPDQFVAHVEIICRDSGVWSRLRGAALSNIPRENSVNLSILKNVIG